MADWLPWALLVFVTLVLAAMPWRRPHPNREFMLHKLRLLEDEDTNVASCSLPIGRPANTRKAGRALRICTANEGLTVSQ